MLKVKNKLCYASKSPQKSRSNWKLLLTFCAFTRITPSHRKWLETFAHRYKLKSAFVRLCATLKAHVRVKQGSEKTAGSRDKTRQPLRSHQVCRDTLEHSKPDGICPPGARSRPDDKQAQRQEKKEGRIGDGISCLWCTICFSNMHAIMNSNIDYIID